MTIVIDGPVRRTALVERRVAGPADLPGVLALLGRCSRETLYRRFHGFTDGARYADQLLGSGGVDPLTLGVWDGTECRGIATLAPHPGSADLAVLIEDRWQRRGLGTVLVRSLLGAAPALGVVALHVDLLAENGSLVAVLRRIGPVMVHLSWGVYEVEVDLRRKPASPSIEP